MAGPDYEKLAAADRSATEDREGFGSDSGNDEEEYSRRSTQRYRRSEDRRRYDRETLGQEEEVETLLAVGEKGSKRKSRKGALRRLEQGGQESTSESSSLIDSSEDDLRRLGEVQHSSKQVGQAKQHEGMRALRSH